MLIAETFGTGFKNLNCVVRHSQRPSVLKFEESI
jgi:hypothetical protein